MLSLLLVICIVGIVVGVKIYDHDCDTEDCGLFVGTASFIAAGIVAVCLIINMVQLTNLKIIDEKIAIYQEENTKIESQVETLVSQYEDYETGIFKDLKSDADVTLALSLYPELKADKLVTKQLNLYVKNNTKIKELKVEKLQGKIYRWWLYFGK